MTEWEKGRQNTGYDKLLLLVNPLVIPFDCYLLRLPVFKLATAAGFRLQGQSECFARSVAMSSSVEMVS